MGMQAFERGGGGTSRAGGCPVARTSAACTSRWGGTALYGSRTRSPPSPVQGLGQSVAIAGAELRTPGPGPATLLGASPVAAGMGGAPG
jgi:hypothetical protein